MVYNEICFPLETVWSLFIYFAYTKVTLINQKLVKGAFRCTGYLVIISLSKEATFYQSL